MPEIAAGQKWPLPMTKHHAVSQSDYSTLSSLITARCRGGELPADDVITLRAVVAKIVTPGLVDIATKQALRRMAPITNAQLIGTILYEVPTIVSQPREKTT